MAQKPSIPKGTRDFSPQEMLRRKYIFSTIEAVFRKYGFLPLETPAMENLETLTGKYGEEGDRLIFKILNSGDAWGDVSDQTKAKLKAGEEVHPGKLAAELSEKALRYDLTVPFARYVVQHQNEIAFPFKRYQIQPVWRADRPQKGRYREFYQCDADVIGSTSLFNELDLVHMIRDIFEDLGIQVVIKVNNRKILAGLAEVSGMSEALIDMTTALDKIEKVGHERVYAELREKGRSEASIAEVRKILEWFPPEMRLWNDMKPNLEGFFKNSAIGLQGVAEIDYLFQNHLALGVMCRLEFDMTLARGLDYYTGAIFEVKALEGSLQSSICGGGRYDDLTGIFGLKNMSGVGISFGADRIYDVLLEKNKFRAELGSSTKLLFATTAVDNEQWNDIAGYCLKPLLQVREARIAAELYPDFTKLPKQFTYAEKKGIPYVAIVGETEMKEGKVTLKRMGANEKGEMVTIEQVIQQLRSA